jgi:hypothetical protein
VWVLPVKPANLQAETMLISTGNEGLPGPDADRGTLRL